VQFFETSAFMKINIEEIFFEAVREIRRYDAAAESARNGGKPPKSSTGRKNPTCSLF
jgi:hypothetical protein